MVTIAASLENRSLNRKQSLPHDPLVIMIPVAAHQERGLISRTLFEVGRGMGGVHAPIVPIINSRSPISRDAIRCEIREGIRAVNERFPAVGKLEVYPIELETDEHQTPGSWRHQCFLGTQEYLPDILRNPDDAPVLFMSFDADMLSLKPGSVARYLETHRSNEGKAVLYSDLDFSLPNSGDVPRFVRNLAALRNVLFRISPFLWEATMAIPEKLYSHTGGYRRDQTLAEGPVLIAANGLGTSVRHVKDAHVGTSARRMAAAVHQGNPHWWGGKNAGHHNKHDVIRAVDINDRNVRSQLINGALGEHAAYEGLRYLAGGTLDVTFGMTSADDRRKTKEKNTELFYKTISNAGLPEHAELFAEYMRAIDPERSADFQRFVSEYGAGRLVPIDFDPKRPDLLEAISGAGCDGRDNPCISKEMI